MNYKTRFLEAKIHECLKTFGAVVVTGPRQAGKTSLINHVGHLIFKDLETVAFDAPPDVDAFRRDPDLFFANHPGPLFLDEVQHVPDIFPYLKKEVDRTQGHFRFFISGSQSFALMKGVSESLAGRAAILDLWPFCTQEALGVPDRSTSLPTLEFLENPQRLQALLGRTYPLSDRRDIVPAMLKGGYPKVLIQHAGTNWLESYRRTYIQRDIRELRQVGDLGRFDRLTVLCAGRSGSVINKSEFSRILGVDNKTIDSWLSLLETSYQTLSLPPYFANTTKRLVKRPKHLFADIGLALHLQGIRDPQALFNAPHFGNLFETFVIMEIRKLYGHAGLPWDGHFWRTPQGIECDIILPAQGFLIPMEIKHGMHIRSNDLKGLQAFMATHGKQTQCGLVISLNPRVEKLADRIWNLPLGLILGGVG